MDGAGKRIVEEAYRKTEPRRGSVNPRTDADDPNDALSEFERSIVSGDNKSVRLQLPLRDPVECQRHLRRAIEVFDEILLRLSHKSRDVSHLFVVRGMIRQLNREINSYRWYKGD